MTDPYTPTTEEIREYLEAADRVTAHMFSPDAPDAAEAFERWLAAHDAQVRAEALRKAGSWYWTHAEETMRQTVPQGDHYVSVSQWLVDEADRIADTNQEGTRG